MFIIVFEEPFIRQVANIFFSQLFSFLEEFNILKITLNVLAFPLWISFYILLETNG